MYFFQFFQIFSIYVNMDVGIAVSRDDFESVKPTHSHALGKFKFQPKPFNSTNYKEYNRNELLTKTFAKSSKTTNLMSKLPDVVTAANAVQLLLIWFTKNIQSCCLVSRERNKGDSIYLPHYFSYNNCIG